jgi:hypothetical protein
MTRYAQLRLGMRLLGVSVKERHITNRHQEYPGCLDRDELLPAATVINVNLKSPTGPRRPGLLACV